MKIKGLKSAVGDYKRFNSDGRYSPEYGLLMFDAETGEVWTDQYFDASHGSWKNYNSATVFNLGRMMQDRYIEISMKNVKEFIEANFQTRD